VSFGIKVWPSVVSKLVISNNLGAQLEDRASDGKGGLLAARPGLGHFIILNNVAASPGATIAWNQLVQVIGESSTEDPINIYQSWGSTGHPIWVHDNYLEGYSSTTTTSGYTGSGIVADGAGTGPQTGNLLFQNNEMVHTAGAGIEIANGHDVVAEGNRIVSCGKDSFGNWFAMNSVNAAEMYNNYNSTHFYNNVITTTAGGMVRPDPNNNPMTADLWANAPDLKDPGNSASGNAFTDPCFSGTALILTPENAERAFWRAKVLAAGQLIGDQHF